MNSDQRLAVVEETLKNHMIYTRDELAILKKNVSRNGVEQVAHAEQIRALTRWQEVQNGTLKEVCDLIRTLTKEMQELNLAFVVGRPSWMMTVIIGIAAAIIGGALGVRFF